MHSTSLLAKERLNYKPKLPLVLQNLTEVVINKENAVKVSADITPLFPLTSHQPLLKFTQGHPKKNNPLRVGVVLSGGQAAGGHNVITGLFDALHALNKESVFIGFQNGPKGIIENKNTILNAKMLEPYRNQGGFDLIGSGRDKIEKPEQLQAAMKTMTELNLDGLVIIGGDDSNTNAAILAEYFKTVGCKTAVIGVPKTIDGDLKNDFIEVSFGFDTACKVYSEIIGNLARDALSAGKYYFFIKLMGRSASHIALECALKTHPNLTLIGEEIAATGQSLKDIVEQITMLIMERSVKGKDHGVILIPEGVIEFIPEFKTLISELNLLLAEGMDGIIERLSPSSRSCYEVLPKDIQEQLLIGRDAHGNVQVSKIETERLFIDMVAANLKSKGFKGKFNPQPCFCGYEGRAALPSNFDSQYCYALGYVAAALINNGASGYMSCLKHLSKTSDKWIPIGVPLTSMMTIEKRQGKSKPVIEKALVDIEGPHFAQFKQVRNAWSLNDAYAYPGPIQFFGPSELTDTVPGILG